MKQTLIAAQVSFLPCVNADDSEIETISLAQALFSDAWRAKVEAIRAEKNPAKQKALKDALPCFMPAGTFRHPDNSGLIAPSGFLYADIDYKPEKGENTALGGFDLKAEIWRVPFVAYCGLSCRGAGYSLLIPIADPAKYRDYYKALQVDFEKCGLTLDPACKNIGRKKFVSWDADPYINTAARPYSYTLPEREHTTRETLGRELDAAETAAKVEAVISYLEANRLDITADYDTWTGGLLAPLANTFGEAGRDYAHRISQFHPKYTAAETDAKYSSFLKGYQGRAAGIGTFFYNTRLEIGKYDFEGLEL
ncbi:MAG: PriCT-2 domain-containing protein [Bacteroidales bacterium]|jgi:hypothetical protein|nr:PriCT-2 domain-containing protein [Bacteroidales bacterium]